MKLARLALALGITLSGVLSPAFSARAEAAPPLFEFGPVQVSPIPEQHVVEPPTVAAAADGSFVVAWVEDGSQFAAYFQRYAAAGTPQGSVTRASPPTHFVYGQSAAVAMAADGSFVVAWVENGFQHAAFFQRYDAAGFPLGSVTQASPPGHLVFNANGPTNAAVAMAADGSFVVAWVTRNQPFAAFFQRYDADGTPQGSVTRANPQTHFVVDQSAAVAMAADGSFVVSWFTGNQPFAAFFQRYDANGTPLGSVTQASPPGQFVITPPAVSMAADGSFVVAWLEITFLGASFFQRYDADGSPQGSVTQIHPPTHFVSEPPTVAMAADGSFVVAWTPAIINQETYSAFFQRYNAAGTPQGSAIQASPPEDYLRGVSPAVAATNGSIIVAWSSEAAVFFNLFVKVGSPPPHPVNPTRPTHPSK